MLLPIDISLTRTQYIWKTLSLLRCSMQPNSTIILFFSLTHLFKIYPKLSCFSSSKPKFVLFPFKNENRNYCQKTKELSRNHCTSQTRNQVGLRPHSRLTAQYVEVPLLWHLSALERGCRPRHRLFRSIAQRRHIT